MRNVLLEEGGDEGKVGYCSSMFDVRLDEFEFKFEFNQSPLISELALSLISINN